MATPRIAFVQCPSYHGATLLALLLNNHPDICSLGDMLPTRAYDQRCACGKPVSACGFWQDLLGELEPWLPAAPSPYLPCFPALSGSNRLNRFLSWVITYAGLGFGSRLWRPLQRRARDFAGAQLRFYSTVSRRMGTKVFVDGEKQLIKPFLLKSILGDEVDMAIIHLYRDPRGFQCSAAKYGAGKLRMNMREWRRYHSTVEYFGRRYFPGRYYELSYESLCASPESRMNEIFDFLHLARVKVCVAPQHPERNHLMGNKAVFSFDGSVQLDAGWEITMAPAEQRRALALAGRRAAEHGYVSGA